MAIHRRFLYAGLFLVAIGGVLVAADLTGVNDAWLREALRLWPLAIITIGLAIVVRRTSFALPAGVLAAVGPGLLFGGSMVAGPRVAFECGDAAVPASTLERAGALSQWSTISLSAACGTSTITSAPGNAWRVSAGSTDGRVPEVTSDSVSLSIDSPGRGGRQLLLGDRREDWEVTIPTTPVDLLGITAHANSMVLALPGATIGVIAIEADASTLRLDATGATIDELSLELDFGSASILLPATRHLTGTLEVNVGSLRLCQPAGSGMSVAFAGDGPHEVSVAGAPWASPTWTGGNVLSSNQIELTVDATFGSVEINPIGGCA